MGEAMLTIMTAFAQFEHDTLIDRTRAGLASGRSPGTRREPSLED